MYLRHFLIAIVAAAAAHNSWADSARATAVLSNSEAQVGQMVQMEIKVSGANNIDAPNDISVDGLEIHRTGTSRQFEMHNFSTTSSVTYSYTILPLKAGTFKIPSQDIRAGGAPLRTEELTLHVVGSAGGRNPNPQNSNGSEESAPNVDASKLAFAELVVPKKTAYVGEVIPAVVRIGFFVRGQPIELPEIKAQGFTVQKLQMPDRPQIETVNGRRCEIWVFKTAIAATRPGKFEIGPVQANSVVIVPRPRPRTTNRPHSPFDLFNMDDPFSDPFFADPFGTMGQQQKRTIASEPVPLEVKPLPANAPADFAGAVGNFTMTVDANPKSVQTGDPITVTSTITGRGNFDRVNAPALEDEHGWHKYPPSSKFKQDDDVGISGIKTFELVLSPNERKQNIAPFSFSYFDPAKEKYVTVRSEPIPIRVEGATLAASTPAPGTATAPAVTPATTAAPGAPVAATTPKQQDILYQLTSRPARAQSFSPLYAQRNFWLAQIVPLLALLSLAAWRIRTSRLGNREARRAAALQEEISQLMKSLRREDAPAADYFSQASRAVQVKTALARNVDPGTVDAETAAAAFQLDENSRAQLRGLFQRSDEARYSGAANGGISREDRKELIDLINRLRS